MTSVSATSRPSQRPDQDDTRSRPPGWEERLKELERRAYLGISLFDQPLPATVPDATED
jgi:hypothetical protein